MLRKISTFIKSQSADQLLIMAVLAGFSLIAIVMRLAAVPAETGDFTVFLNPWMNYMNTHGFSAFADNFANYNTPYLVMLWIATYLPIGYLEAVKIISIVFDFVLAFGVAKVVYAIRPTRYLSYAAFFATLFLPTVFLNSALWGQCDAIYVSFMVWALYFGLKDRQKMSWLLFGVAFAFKLQAIFFLPFMVMLHLNHKWRLWSFWPAIVAFVVLTGMPLFAGKSLTDTFTVYATQTQSSPTDGLSSNAATMYQWLPNQYHDILVRVGTIFAAGVSLAIVSAALVKKRLNGEQLIMLATLCLFAVTYSLPLMHERYFYGAEILSLILCFIRPKLAWIVVVMQVVSVISFGPYFGLPQFTSPAIPFSVLSGFVLLIVYMLTKETLTNILPLAKDKSMAKK
jgi:Gpi18-like mannosyltransferase